MTTREKEILEAITGKGAHGTQYFDVNKLVTYLAQIEERRKKEIRDIQGWASDLSGRRRTD